VPIAFTEALPALDALITRTRLALQLTEDGTDAHKQLKDLLDKEEKLWAQIAIHSADATKTTTKGKPNREKEIELLRTQAQKIEEGARGALQLAEAFGLVDDNAASALNSIVQIAANVQAALKGDLSSVLGVAGGLASIASNCFGGTTTPRNSAGGRRCRTTRTPSAASRSASASSARWISPAARSRSCWRSCRARS
jgi:hypothetical protein